MTASVSDGYRCEKNPYRKRTVHMSHLFGGRGVLGDGLGALRDGVLGQLTGEDEADTGKISKCK
jgi:hypothetical protein